MRASSIHRSTAVLLAVGLLAACGSDEDTTASPDTAAVTTDGEDVVATTAAEEPDEQPTPTDASPASTEPPPPTGETPPAEDCGTLKVAMNDSPQNRAVSYAIDQGIVESDVVDLDVSGLPVPALIEEAQSFATYDLIEATLNGIAFGISNSAPLVIIGPGQTGVGTGEGEGAVQVFVQADSDIESLADTSGAKIGTVGLGATTTQILAIVLDAKYGIDARYEGGDVSYRELPFDQLVVALKNGDVDLIATSHLAAYLAQDDPEVRLLGVTDHEYREVSGGPDSNLTTLLSVAPKVEGREACFIAARELIAESMDYAQANIGEVASAIAASSEGGDPAVIEAFVTTWITTWFDYPAIPTDDVIDAWQQQVDLGAEAGVNPPIDVRASVLTSG